MKKEILAKIKDGELFSVAGIEFIKFYDDNGNTISVSKDCLFDSVFGDKNNFATSEVLEKLKKEVLPKIEQEVGAENIVEHEVDLLSLDGSDKWGKLNTKISIPTFDFYRKNVKIFDKHKLDGWWWLATADCVSEHIGNDYYTSCVSPRGNLNYYNCRYNYGGVRPFLNFVSSISVSCEE